MLGGVRLVFLVNFKSYNIVKDIFRKVNNLQALFCIISRKNQVNDNYRTQRSI
jgi:hypothetical protein